MKMGGRKLFLFSFFPLVRLHGQQLVPPLPPPRKLEGEKQVGPPSVGLGRQGG